MRNSFTVALFSRLARAILLEAQLVRTRSGHNAVVNTALWPPAGRKHRTCSDLKDISFQSSWHIAYGGREVGEAHVRSLLRCSQHARSEDALNTLGARMLSSKQTRGEWERASQSARLTKQSSLSLCPAQLSSRVNLYSFLFSAQFEPFWNPFRGVAEWTSSWHGLCSKMLFFFIELHQIWKQIVSSNSNKILSLDMAKLRPALRVPGLPITDCTGSCNSSVQMCTRVNAIDVTGNIICERLYLVSGLGSFGPWVNCPYAPTTPTLPALGLGCGRHTPSTSIWFLRANLLYVPNIEMYRIVGSRSVHDFGTCKKNADAQCRVTADFRFLRRSHD